MIGLCPKCGRPVEADSTPCRKCGAALTPIQGTPTQDTPTLRGTGFLTASGVLSLVSSTIAIIGGILALWVSFGFRSDTPGILVSFGLFATFASAIGLIGGVLVLERNDSVVVTIGFVLLAAESVSAMILPLSSSFFVLFALPVLIMSILGIVSTGFVKYGIKSAKMMTPQPIQSHQRSAFVTASGALSIVSSSMAIVFGLLAVALAHGVCCSGIDLYGWFALLASPFGLVGGIHALEQSHLGMVILGFALLVAESGFMVLFPQVSVFFVFGLPVLVMSVLGIILVSTYRAEFN